MKKFILSISLIGAFAFYVLMSSPQLVLVVAQTPVSPPTEEGSNQNPTPPISGNPTETDTQSQPPATAPTPAPVPVAAAPKPSSGLYKDGSYTGPLTDAYYGYVQVQAVIQGGKLADVSFLRYPNDRGTSIYINSQAMPYLKMEAIQAQSAKVDIISGATATSEAFIKSLGSALASAKS
ncbi:MAG: FMN-binding protein [Patescibacteria group bacterium]|nr:FMN-binding protein [Patescibacteria group bacterium]MDE2015310.1 FMN-binding protein [Patescibacteria group bacterium]MDE2227115.1 FMN-binding protein [Patescibacteria group bacterium]